MFVEGLHVDYVNGPVIDPVPAPSSSAPWVTFKGIPGESASAFTLSVQRIAFRQGRGWDDAWLVDYASTCFEDEALYWYLEQNEESRSSWRNLRSNLLSRYPPSAAAGVTSRIITPSIVTSPPSGPQLKTTLEGITGCIKVVGHHTEPLGYLALDSQLGTTVTLEQTQALGVTLTTTKLSSILQIHMVLLDALCDGTGCRTDSRLVGSCRAVWMRRVHFPTWALL